MLYQLIAYYTIHKGTKQTLWEYLSWTVIIFQNAAVLEVNDLNIKKRLKRKYARSNQVSLSE